MNETYGGMNGTCEGTNETYDGIDFNKKNGI